MNESKQSEDGYARLREYSDQRRRELSEMFNPVVEITDRYGALICRITIALGSSAPKSTQEIVIRDLMADVFDFLYEWRRPLLEGRIQVAYPLARRAYESLSLLSICAQDTDIADRWEKGKKITNYDIRRALAGAHFPESEEELKDLYRFFSKATHPNRDLIPYRYLGEGNLFVLGSIGEPSLVLVTDHCITLLQMWFWFAAAVSYYFQSVIDKADKSYRKDYLKTADKAKQVVIELQNTFNELLKGVQVVSSKSTKMNRFKGKLCYCAFKKTIEALKGELLRISSPDDRFQTPFFDRGGEGCDIISAEG